MNAAGLLSCRKRAASLLRPDRVTWLAFALLSLLAVNFFAEIADGEADPANFLAAPAVLVMYLLFAAGIVLFGFSHFLVQVALHPLFIALAFAYLYALSCLPSYLLRRTRKQA